MKTISIGKTLYKTNRDDIFEHHRKCTGKHKIVKSKGAEKRDYPFYSSDMSTADYVNAYETNNYKKAMRWDWQPLSTTPTIVSGEESYYED